MSNLAACALLGATHVAIWREELYGTIECTSLIPTIPDDPGSMSNAECEK